ncbi:hypothetical protein G5B47_07925 [Paenibacillus sp. 7124]|uniref:Uncharacterized protein n=1 Tax=Paenibacillus apii TaxID=1850370 RepID=A0A6M1PIZ7_9BACL|nr:hypothetical protein [Paenibacillus apii]NGM82342.1 hypothetical protein [Paenibacillus apii]
MIAWNPGMINNLTATSIIPLVVMPREVLEEVSPNSRRFNITGRNAEEGKRGSAKSESLR